MTRYTISLRIPFFWDKILCQWIIRSECFEAIWFHHLYLSICARNVFVDIQMRTVHCLKMGFKLHADAAEEWNP